MQHTKIRCDITTTAHRQLHYNKFLLKIMARLSYHTCPN